jgi:RNA ligase
MYGGLFTQAELACEERDGFVRSNEHPEDNEMWILNYTEKAAFDGHWNNVTLNTRGLIVGPFCDILARPFPKFFNYGQPGCPEIDLDEPAVVSDKMDGSLGILYREKLTGKLAIATRGSFTSDQAIHATNLLRTKYRDFQPFEGWTYLFEIVYPENRIVCDYGDRDELVFLGAVNIESGVSVDSDWSDWLGWQWAVAEVLPYTSMREALEADARTGKEGVVVHLLDSDVRVKIKQEDYVLLHRIVTGLNARSVWQAMVDGTVEELIEQVPDEFHDFVRGVQKDINQEVNELVNYSQRKFARIDAALDQSATRRDFAMLVKDENYSWALFNLWDGKPIRPKFLQLCKPKHDYSPVKVSGDAD